jgi:hypothetical protein
MSAEPSLDERKQFFMWAYARQSFHDVHKSARYLAAPPAPLSKEVKRMLFIGIVVTYARPFSQCHGLEKMLVDVVPKRFANLHRELMDMRNKEAGHIDAVGYEPTGSEFGNINQVRIAIKPCYSEIHVFSTDIPTGEIRELSQQLYDKAVYHVERFRTKYIEKSNLSRGEYRLNIDSSDPRSFIKLEPASKTASTPPAPPSAPSLPPNT